MRAAGLAQLGFHQFVENVKKDGGRTLFRRAGPPTGNMVEFQPTVREHVGQLFSLFGVDLGGFITLERFVERVVRRTLNGDAEPQADALRREPSSAVAAQSSSSPYDSARTDLVASNPTIRDQHSYARASSPAPKVVSNVGGSAWLDAESYVARLAELEQVADAHDSLLVATERTHDGAESVSMMSQSDFEDDRGYDTASVASEPGNDSARLQEHQRRQQQQQQHSVARPVPTAVPRGLNGHRRGAGQSLDQQHSQLQFRSNMAPPEYVANQSATVLERLQERQHQQQPLQQPLHQQQTADGPSAAELVRGRSYVQRPFSPATRATPGGDSIGSSSLRSHHRTGAEQSDSKLQSRAQSQSRSTMVAPMYDPATDSTTVAEITARLDILQADILAEVRRSGTQLTMIGGVGKHVDVHEAVKVVQAGLLRYGNEGRWRPAFHDFELHGGVGGSGASRLAAGGGLATAEFVALLRREQTRLTPDVVSDATLSRLLEVFDLNADGLLSFEEFRALLHYRLVRQ